VGGADDAVARVGQQDGETVGARTQRATSVRLVTSASADGIAAPAARRRRDHMDVVTWTWLTGSPPRAGPELLGDETEVLRDRGGLVPGRAAQVQFAVRRLAAPRSRSVKASDILENLV